MTHPSSLTYTYDQGGNRLTKTDNNNIQTVYHYDLEDPADYLTKNNRLMYYEVFDITNERVDYEYELGDEPRVGNATKIARKVGNVAPFDVYASCLKYNRCGELWFVTEKSWQEDADGGTRGAATLC